jgi:hypothetical protein
MNDSASYVSMPGGNGSQGSQHSHSGSGELDTTTMRDKTCACIVSHTYKQIRKLWELPKDKQAMAVAAAGAGVCPQHHNNTGLPPGVGHNFNLDEFDRSTSSSTGL